MLQANEIPENYLLLADCYLRNDKAVDAELVLRNLARKMPESVLVKYHLLEAYTRGEKFDEISTTMEMINNLLPELPGAVEFKYQEYMQIENYDQAEIMAEKYHRLKPGNMMDYTMQTTMALQKGNMDEAQAILKEGQKKHYLDWGLTQLWASLLSQTTKSQKAAIKVYKNYLKHRYYNEAVFVLANTYLYDSDIEGCEKTLNEYLKRNPSATGIYNSLGRIYFQTQDYKKAELNLNKALEQCPGYSGYWALLGEILQGQDNIEAAIAAYRTALSYDPKDYDTIARLRELEGKDNVFEYFDSPDIKKLWENASASEDYPEDNALFLFDMTKYVIYPEGGSEKEQEILIKVFNNDGISEFSEYWIDYYSSSEQLIVDKATVYKPDGTEIRGDVSSNQIVFKSLEPGDCIYVKHRIRNFNRGRLSRHLWDEFYFNYYYPVEDIRYEVLVPESFSVNFKTKNMPDEPVVSDTDFGRLYRWQLWDQPALEWEYDMPELKDVGKMFYISSIPDWQYLVDWYQDLASTKTRSSYEIEETVAEIMAGYENATDYEKIELVYNYITENINYSSVPFRQSGLIPQKARDVLVEKLGDCNDVATLAIAMLDELGITANYVLVNTVNEGLNRGILPALEFNHAIARAEYDGQEIYMDLTAQNYPLHTLPPMDQGAFILNIKPGIVEPGWITDEYYSHGATRRKTTVTIDEELTAVMVKENKRTGSPAAGFRRTYRYEGEKDRLKNLTKLMAERYPNSKVERFDIEDLNAIELEIDYSYQITAPNFLEEVGSMKLLQMPWSDRAEFLSALSYEKREFEFNYKTGLDTLIEEIEITFPAGFYPDDFESVTEYSSDIAAYSLTQDWSDDVFKVRREYIVHEHVVAPEDYADFKDFYNKVIKADERQILIKQE
ncbi:MAG: DUF3857 domain-containing protein [FCB group bacterium]|nr:DUF3857 domain-containing protein [FCB group bacterium]